MTIFPTVRAQLLLKVTVAVLGAWAAGAASSQDVAPLARTKPSSGGHAATISHAGKRSSRPVQAADTRAPGSPAEQQPTPALIVADQGQLTIIAENSSLSAILRDVAARTGLRITGTVHDDRVFGIYGPAPFGAVMTELLDGTGVNVLMMEDENHAPEELVLTPRNDVPVTSTPARSAYHQPEAVADTGPPPTSPAIAPAQPFRRIVAAPGAFAAPPPAGASGAAGAGADGSGTQPSPSGAKTPEQIYQELMQQKAAGSATPH
jgi:hypothetical protein